MSDSGLHPEGTRRTESRPRSDPAEREPELLLAALRAGDPEAEEALVRSETPRLLRLARRILKDEEEARDAVQDAFLQAFRSLPTFHGAAKLSTWLYRIGMNAALMRLRSRRRHPEAFIEDLLPRFLDDGHHAVNARPWPGVDDLLGERELLELVRDRVDQLPEMYRTVLLLRDVEQLDTEETAQALGVTCNVVKVRLHRARQALRALLEPALVEPRGRAC